MADEKNDPGFISSLMATLKPKDNGSIPQKWLDSMLANTNSNNAQLKALITIVDSGNKSLTTQNVLQVHTLENISKAIGPSFKQTMIDSFKAYDKELKNSDSVKDQDKKYNDRKVQKDKEETDRNKKLATDLSKQLSENVSTNAVGKGSGELEGEAAAAAALTEIQVQPVSIAEIKPDVLESLKKVFSTAVSSTPAGNKEAPTESGNVGILGVLGNGLGALGSGLQKLGTPQAMLGALTLIELGVALIASAKGFQMFSSVNWEGMAKGFVSLLGLVGIAKLLASSSVEMIIGAAAITILGVALIAAGKGFQMFGELDWAAIGKGFTAILGLGAVAVLFGTLSEVIIPGAAALGLLGLALIPFSVALLATAKAFNMFIKPMDEFTKQLSKLNDIGPGNLFKLAGAITALGVAIAGFGAGAAVAGIGNFVGGLFNSISGQKSPIDQLIALGKQASSIDNLSSGINRLKEAMASFGDLKTNFDPFSKFIDSVNNVNILKLAAVAAALHFSIPATVAAQIPNVQGPSSGISNNQTTQIPNVQGPSSGINNIPGSAASLATARLATAEAAKLGGIAVTPESREAMTESPYYKIQETQVRLHEAMIKKMDELIISLRPITTSSTQGDNISNSNSNTTSVLNTSTSNIIAKGGSDGDRDVPYIERNKYRQTMMYARGLL